MPVGDALNSGLLGAAFGFFPIMWIVINAIWIYNLTVETGHFDVLRRSFASVSDDQRIQAIIIAFCFGALMEALAGFGTPVAISSVMLIALGFRPLKAATVALVANTAPVAFGALAVPITTLADRHEAAGRTTWARWSAGRRRSWRCSSRWPWCSSSTGSAGFGRPGRAALVCGVVFGVFQYLASNFWSIPLADIIAVARLGARRARASPACGTRRRAYVETRAATARGDRGAGGGTGDGAAPVTPAGRRPGRGRPGPGRGRGRRGPRTRRGEVFRAYAPVPDHHRGVRARHPRAGHHRRSPRPSPARRGTGLESVTRIFNWPGLHIVSGTGKAVATTFKLNFLSAAGTPAADRPGCSRMLVLEDRRRPGGAGLRTHASRS